MMQPINVLAAKKRRRNGSESKMGHDRLLVGLKTLGTVSGPYSLATSLDDPHHDGDNHD